MIYSTYIKRTSHTHTSHIYALDDYNSLLFKVCNRVIQLQKIPVLLQVNGMWHRRMVSLEVIHMTI